MTDLAAGTLALSELMRVGNNADAAMLAEQLALEHPKDAMIWATLGVLRFMVGKHAGGFEALNTSLMLKDDAMVHQTIGIAYNQAGQNEASIGHLARAVALNPELGISQRTLGFLLMTRGRLHQALHHLRQAMICLPDDPSAHSMLIEAMDYLSETDVATAQAERRRWNETFVVPRRGEIKPHANTRDPERRLRIGYVSPNFTTHSPTRIFGPILFMHDRSKFDVVCFSDTAKDWATDYTDEIRAIATEWHDIVGVPNPEVVEKVRAASIDILVDLSGHGMPNRLMVFARKPAPVQVTAWGFATGTGLETIDYLFADPVSVPQAERPLFAEKIADLSCVLMFDPPDYIPPVNDLPMARNGFVTLGCLNRIQKVDEPTWQLWARILTEIPTARLFLKDTVFDGIEARAKVIGTLEGLGIEQGRFDLVGKTDHAGHLAAYNNIDFALDPLGHSGALCTCEALAMGVPTVGLLGTNLTRRQTAAINMGLGLGDFVARTQEEYVAHVLTWARRPDELAALRPTLRARLQASPIGNAELYTREVEVWYRRMWRDWCART